MVNVVQRQSHFVTVVLKIHMIYSTFLPFQNIHSVHILVVEKQPSIWRC